MSYSIVIEFTVETDGAVCAYKMYDTISNVSNAFSAIETYKSRVIAKYANAVITSVECAAIPD